MQGYLLELLLSKLRFKACTGAAVRPSGEAVAAAAAPAEHPGNMDRDGIQIVAMQVPMLALQMLLVPHRCRAPRKPSRRSVTALQESPPICEKQFVG